MPRRIDIELTSSRPDGSWTWRAAGAREPRGVVDASVLPGRAEGRRRVQGRGRAGDRRHHGALRGHQAARRRSRRRCSSCCRASNRSSRSSSSAPSATGPTAANADGGKRPERGRGARRRRTRQAVPIAARVPIGATGVRSEPNAVSVPIAVRAPSDRTGASIASRGPNARDPTSLPHPSCRSARSRSGCVPARHIGAPFSTRFPRSSARSPSSPCWASRPCVSGFATTTRSSSPKARHRCRRPACSRWPRRCSRGCEWPSGSTGPRPRATRSSTSTYAISAAWWRRPTIRWSHATRPPGSSPAELKAALATKQEQELQLWFGDIDAALRVGRVIRALRLSSQPPKAGVPFPTELAQRLTEGANTSLTPADGAERWCAVLEAAAFSPIRTHVAPSGPPATVADELRTTVTRLAPALPQVAAMFGIEPAPNASMPKPLRPTSRPKPTKPPRKADAPARQRPTRRRTARTPTKTRRRRTPPNPHRRLRHHPPRPTRNTVTKATPHRNRAAPPPQPNATARTGTRRRNPRRSRRTSRAPNPRRTACVTAIRARRRTP